MRYALRKDVLLVMAAGNNSLNIDSIPIYPSAEKRAGKRFGNMVVVGATDRRGRICRFSNYGSRAVDLFAPGWISSQRPLTESMVKVRARAYRLRWLRELRD